MPQSKRLADLATKAWAKRPSSYAPYAAGDCISEPAAEAVARGKDVRVLRPSRQGFVDVRYVAKTLRIAREVMSSGVEGPVADSAAKLLKLNFSYEDALRHAKAFMSAKRRKELKKATQRTLAPEGIFTTRMGYELTRITSEARLVQVARNLGNCLATDGFRKRMAVSGMRAKDIAFFVLACPGGNIVGLLEAVRSDKGAWQAVEFKGKGNEPVPVRPKSIQVLLKKAGVSADQCSDLHDAGIADSLSEIVRSSIFEYGDDRMRIDVAPRAIRIVPAKGKPFLYERARDGWRILGSNAYESECRAIDLLTATAAFWGPVLMDRGIVQQAIFAGSPTT